MGRPIKSETERLALVVAFRVSEKEHAALAARAEARGVAVAEFSRQAALGRPLTVRTEAAPSAAPLPFALVNELQRIGVNLNQLTRLAHIREDVQAEIAVVLAEIRAILDQVHSHVPRKRDRA